MTVVAVIGSRNFKNLEKITERLLDYAGHGELTVISGGANGVDKEAIAVARRMQFHTIEFKPDFKDGYDVREYHRRNDKILDAANKIIAFWDGESNGTGSGIAKALAMRKDIEMIFDH